MSFADPISACPACAAAPLAQSTAERARVAGGTVLSLPGIHCAICIGTVERALHAMPGVVEARVNLGRKRVSVQAPGVAADEMIEVLAGVGYEAHELDGQMMAAVDTDAAGHKLLMRLAVAGFAMMNVMLFSVAVWSGASEATRVMFHWISAAIAVPALVFSAQVFFGSAWSALKVGRLNMDVPISLAIILACAMSVYETSQGAEHVYFDAALSLTFFLLIGRYLDHRMRIAARSAAQELSALELPRATRVVDGAREVVDVADLAIGDHVAVMVGMRVPVDGEILEGQSDMDRSLLSGESLPVAVGPGAALAAGEVNLTAPVILRVTAVGEDTSLRRMAALVETAEGARNRYTALADRAAQIYAPAVHLLALISFIGWMFYSGDMVRSLNVAISVLIITCPCALGLAVPAVMTAASGRLFRRGILVKNGTALERLAEIDTVIFDKTGTLTEGQVQLDLNRFDAGELSVMAALAGASEHPVARAICLAMPGDVVPAKLTDIVEHKGLGMSGRWDGVEVRLGSAAWVGGPASPALKIGAAAPKPVRIDEHLRVGAEDAVSALRRMKLGVQIYSGDTRDGVDRIARKLGLEGAQAQMTGFDKQSAIQSRSEAGAHVLMVGDGLNDTAALAWAHASISPASALDASRAASDMVLLGGDLRAVPETVVTAKLARRLVVQNFMIALGYNMIAIPVAVMGFATPLAAAIAMSASSVTVLVNALRVR